MDQSGGSRRIAKSQLTANPSQLQINACLESPDDTRINIALNLYFTRRNFCERNSCVGFSRKVCLTNFFSEWKFASLFPANICPIC